MIEDPEGNAVDVVPLLDLKRQVAASYAAARERLDDGDAVGAHADWGATRLRLLREHPVSAVPDDRRDAAGGARIAAYDPRLALTARLTDDAPQVEVVLGTSGGGEVRAARVGALRTDLGSLEAWWVLGYGGGLLVPFRDPSNGEQTYGGGRYLLDTVKGADLGADGAGRLRLDLNFAYHPSCAFTPSWSCPLAPPDAALSEPVLAGELLDGAT